MNIFLQQLVPPTLEYVTCDRQFQVTGWSQGSMTLLYGPDNSQGCELGQDIRDILPELVGLEDTIAQLFLGEQMAFELTGIQRPELFLDLFMVCESQTNPENLLLLMRNSSDRMHLEQRISQVAKECSLAVQELSVAQTYLKKVVTSMSDALLVTDDQGAIQQVNQATIDILGYDEAELLKQPIQQLFTDSVGTVTSFPNVLLGEDIEQECQTSAGQIRTLSFSCSSFTHPTTGRREYVCIARDVSLRKQAEEQVQAQIRANQLLNQFTRHLQQASKSEELLEIAVEFICQWLMCDRTIIVQYEPEVGATIAAALVVRPDLPTLPTLVTVPADCPSIVDYLEQQFTLADVVSHITIPLLLNRDQFWGVLLLHHCTQDHIWSQQEVHILEQIAGQIAIALGKAQLYEQLQAANTQLREIAHIDGLTQLANRRSFDQKLIIAWESAYRLQQPLSVILGDVDFFKHYNDYYGHPEGDNCLKAIGQILKSLCQDRPFSAARYGGEEFVLLLPDVDRDELIELATSLHQALHQRALPHPKSAIGDWVTMSLGGVTLNPTQYSWQALDLVSFADQALYQAKQEGRNCSRFWSPPDT